MKALTRTIRIVGGFAVALIVAVTANNVWAQNAPKRSITNIAGDLYRFKNNFHSSVFYVTPGGVLVTDPINEDAAKWLKAEIKKRFNQPIKYLVYSHDHQDHSSGGQVFADTATVVGHELTRAAMVGEKRPTAIPTVTFSDSMKLHLGGRYVKYGKMKIIFKTIALSPTSTLLGNGLVASVTGDVKFLNRTVVIAPPHDKSVL